MLKKNRTKLSLWALDLTFILLFPIYFSNAAALGENCSLNYTDYTTNAEIDHKGDCSAGYCINGTCQLGIVPSVGIGDFRQGEAKPIGNSTISEFIGEIYKYAIGVVGILATVVMMIGGFIWITAGGNAGQIGEAKTWIAGALTGLVLVLSSWLIINTVNPKLSQFEPLKLEKIDDMPRCCDPKTGPQIATFNKDSKTYTCNELATCGEETKCEKPTDSDTYTCVSTKKLQDSMSSCEEKNGILQGVSAPSDSSTIEQMCGPTCHGQENVSGDSFKIYSGGSYLTGRCCICN